MKRPGETWNASSMATCLWGRGLTAWGPSCFFPQSCCCWERASGGVDGSCGATTGCAAAVDNKDLGFMTVGPSLRIEDCWEGMGSTSLNGTRVGQKAGRPAGE